MVWADAIWNMLSGPSITRLQKKKVHINIALLLYWTAVWNTKWLQLFESWWRHEMETFSALMAICARNSPVPGDFPAQRPMTRSFDVFFDLRLSKLLSKQPWGWWFETPSRPLWRHPNVILDATRDKCTKFIRYLHTPTYHFKNILRAIYWSFQRESYMYFVIYVYTV